VRLTTSPPSVSPLSRKCGSFNVSQPYGPSWRVMREIYLLLKGTVTPCIAMCRETIRTKDSLKDSRIFDLNARDSILHAQLPVVTGQEMGFVSGSCDKTHNDTASSLLITLTSQYSRNRILKKATPIPKKPTNFNFQKFSHHSNERYLQFSCYSFTVHLLTLSVTRLCTIKWLDD
jgi:hypothetical protein